MTLNEAFQKAIKDYFRGKLDFKNINEASPKKFKYTKEYFDRVAEEAGIKKVEHYF